MANFKFLNSESILNHLKKVFHYNYYFLLFFQNHYYFLNRFDSKIKFTFSEFIIILAFFNNSKFLILNKNLSIESDSGYRFTKSHFGIILIFFFF
jgi:hypothetical protein